MTQAARTTTTLLVLMVLLAAGLAWGWSATTAPLPGPVAIDDCSTRQVKEGDPVYVDQVLVSVLNASDRIGLASRTMQLLVEQGFAAGDRGNAPDEIDVAKAQIWTDEPDSPAVRLVKSWLGPRVEIVPAPIATDVTGVIVVIGDDFKGLARGREKAVSKVDTTLCSPPPPELAG